MRVETVNGRHLLCGHILKREQLAIGQIWAPASGGNYTVKIIAIEGDWITYEWKELGQLTNYTKDWFAFQCRYCLVLPTPEIPKELQ